MNVNHLTHDFETLYQLKKSKAFLCSWLWFWLLIYTPPPPSALGSSLHQGEKQYKNHSDPPLRELNLCEITEDADHLDVLHVPQLQNQEWNCSNQQYKDPYTDFKGKPEEAPPDGLLTPLQFSNSWFLTIRFQILVYLTQCRKIPSPLILLLHI